MIELKRCPFCGCEAVIEEEDFCCVVSCASNKDCNARVSAIDESVAIEKWNRRVTQK